MALIVSLPSFQPTFRADRKFGVLPSLVPRSSRRKRRIDYKVILCTEWSILPGMSE